MHYTNKIQRLIFAFNDKNSTKTEKAYVKYQLHV